MIASPAKREEASVRRNLSIEKDHQRRRGNCREKECGESKNQKKYQIKDDMREEKRHAHAFKLARINSQAEDRNTTSITKMERKEKNPSRLTLKARKRVGKKISQPITRDGQGKWGGGGD